MKALIATILFTFGLAIFIGIIIGFVFLDLFIIDKINNGDNIGNFAKVCAYIGLTIFIISIQFPIIGGALIIPIIFLGLGICIDEL